eukprot:NODE_189_length_13483_cov_0.581067.p7 type:complete len:180 gc:universal NODE_189_length_13483_cov_0.581067:1908-1369(-)
MTDAYVPVHVYELIAVRNLAEHAKFFIKFNNFSLHLNDNLFGHFSISKEVQFLKEYCHNEMSRGVYSMFLFDVLRNEIEKRYASDEPQIRNIHRHLIKHVINCEFGEMLYSDKHALSTHFNEIQSLITEFERNIGVINSNTNLVLENTDGNVLNQIRHPQAYNSPAQIANIEPSNTTQQ